MIIGLPLQIKCIRDSSIIGEGNQRQQFRVTSMSWPAATLRQFASYIISDCARRVPYKVAGRFMLKGNAVSIQSPLPEHLRSEQAGKERRKYLAALPKSDQPFRLALAHEALVKAGENQSVAALSLHVLLKDVTKQSIEQQRKERTQGISASRVQFSFGKTKRWRRGQKRPQEVYFWSETLRTYVAREKHRTPDFERRFEQALGSFTLQQCKQGRCDSFCASYCVADAALDRQVKLAEAFEARLASGLTQFDWIEATPLASVALLYNEMGQFETALPYYRRALHAALACNTPEPRCSEVVAWIEAETARCQEGQLPEQQPHLPIRKELRRR